MENLNVICMSFDGDFQRERPLFDNVDDAWEYADDLGSKWFFYPFVFVATEKTIKDAPKMLSFLIGKRIKTVQKLFKQHNETLLNSGEDDVDDWEFAFSLTLFNDELFVKRD